MLDSVKKSSVRKQEVSLLDINENIQESMTSINNDQVKNVQSNNIRKHKRSVNQSVVSGGASSRHSKSDQDMQHEPNAL